METLTKSRRSNVRQTIAQNTVIGNSLKDNAIFAMGLIQQQSLLLGLDTMSLDEINDEIRKKEYPCRMTKDELRLEVAKAEVDYANGLCITHEELLKEEAQWF